MGKEEERAENVVCYPTERIHPRSIDVILFIRTCLQIKKNKIKEE
jgi:hypothetical protein